MNDDIHEVMKDIKTRRQLFNSVVDLLGDDLIENINHYCSGTQINLPEKYIVFGTDLTDGFDAGVCINDFEYIQRNIDFMTYDDYKKLERAIDMIVYFFTGNTYDIKPHFRDYVSSNFGEYFYF